MKEWEFQLFHKNLKSMRRRGQFGFGKDLIESMKSYNIRNFFVIYRYLT